MSKKRTSKGPIEDRIVAHLECPVDRDEWRRDLGRLLHGFFSTHKAQVRDALERIRQFDGEPRFQQLLHQHLTATRERRTRIAALSRMRRLAVEEQGFVVVMEPNGTAVTGRGRSYSERLISKIREGIFSPEDFLRWRVGLAASQWPGTGDIVTWVNEFLASGGYNWLLMLFAWHISLTGSQAIVRRGVLKADEAAGLRRAVCVLAHGAEAANFDRLMAGRGLQAVEGVVEMMALAAQGQNATRGRKGIWLRKASEVLQANDRERIQDQVKRWRQSRVPLPPVLGFHPGHSQIRLYEPSAFVEWVKKVDGYLTTSEDELIRVFTSISVEPAPKK